MNEKLRAFLIIALKHAVAAVLTNAALMAMFSQDFNFHNLTGVLDILKATGAIVAGAEAKVWLPKILKWATSTDETLQP